MRLGLESTAFSTRLEFFDRTGSIDQKLKRLGDRWQSDLLFVFLMIFLSAMTGVRQSRQANRLIHTTIMLAHAGVSRLASF